jgi:hypothetical protein
MTRRSRRTKRLEINVISESGQTMPFDSLPVERPLSLPVARKLPFRFRPTQVTAAWRPLQSLLANGAGLKSRRQCR